MAPRFDDGRLSVSTPAMYFWQEAAQAYRRVGRADSSGQAVLIVDEDLAATLEV
jgi:hypothetical protein